MIETIFGIMLAISLIGNYVQHETNKELKDDLYESQMIAKANEESWLTAIEVNQNNAATIYDIRQALAACEERNTTIVERVNQFNQATALKDAAINDLRARLDRVDFGSCRVPDWVSFESTD